MRDILLPHLLRADAVMFDTQQTGHARWIAGHILANGLARITIRDVVRAYRHMRAPERRRELAEVMTSFEAAGWLRASPVEGNPTRWEVNPTRWEVNPRVHGVAARAKAEQETRTEAKRRITEATARSRARS
jgi:hypothetical protein